MAKANITPSASHMLREEDIAAHPNQSQLLPRGMSNLVWDVHFLTLGKLHELKVTGNWTCPETVSSFATGFVDVVEAWEAVE